MSQKELLIQVFKNHSMKAKVYGAMTELIPDAEYNEMANEILLLLQETNKAQDAIGNVAKANEYLDKCEMMYCNGEVFSESGYSPSDVQRAIRIAAGLE